MTTQAAETLIYNKERLSLQSLPLEEYFKLAGNRPPFSLMATNNWRGYIGEWSIVNQRLYLSKLLQMSLRKTDNGVLPCLVPNDVTLPEIFPDSSGPIFADWYTGQLRCPEGEVIDYHRGPFGALYERYLVLSVERGVVVHEEVVESIERVSSTPATEETASEQDDRTSKFRSWLKKIV